MFRQLAVTILSCATMLPCHAQTIQHSFLAIDESRDSLVYIDENNPSAHWAISIPKSRGIQLVGQNRVMISQPNGFIEYDLTTKQKVRTVALSSLSGVESVRRLADGRTICAAAGVKVYTISPAGTLTKTVTIANSSGTFRSIRLTTSATYLVGSGDDLIEADTTGKVVKRVAGATGQAESEIYQAVRLPNKKIVLTSGYAQFVDILDSNWSLIKAIGGPNDPAICDYNFFAGFQVLKNGHIVVSNWQGHGYTDGNGKCSGLIEFDTSGARVWKWMDQTRVSSLHAVIILDSLNTALLNDDVNGILGPVGGVTNAGETGFGRPARQPDRMTGIAAGRFFDLRGAAVPGTDCALTSGILLRAEPLGTGGLTHATVLLR